jgi:predicted MarR family transcription regulator
LSEPGFTSGFHQIECGREAFSRWQVARGLAYILRMALNAHIRSLHIVRSRWRSLPAFSNGGSIRPD